MPHDASSGEQPVPSPAQKPIYADLCVDMAIVVYSCPVSALCGVRNVHHSHPYAE